MRIVYIQKSERRVYFVMYNFKKDVAYVPDDDFDAIHTASCMVDTLRHLPMDSPDNQESFEMLLDIDSKARTAIRKKNDQIMEYVSNPDNMRIQSFHKMITEIKRVISNGLMDGSISEEICDEVTDLLDSEYIRPWEEELGKFLKDYRTDKDTETLIESIRKACAQIGIPEKMVEEKISLDGPESELRLLGAMFITDDSFDEKLGKKGLERFEK